MTITGFLEKLCGLFPMQPSAQLLPRLQSYTLYTLLQGSKVDGNDAGSEDGSYTSSDNASSLGSSDDEDDEEEKDDKSYFEDKFADDDNEYDDGLEAYDLYDDQEDLSSVAEPIYLDQLIECEL